MESLPPVQDVSGADAPHVDAGEVMQLVLHWLAAGPCSGAAAALQREAEALGLLPKRHDVRGGASAQTYRRLAAAQPHLPGDALPQLLQQVLAAKRLCGAPGAAGLTSLLAEGPLATIPHLAAAFPPPPPRALRAPFASAALPECLLLRQAGAAAARGAAPPPSFVAGRMQRHTTVRGHRLAVYCVAFDRRGGLVITGADDYLVKIWDVRTGLLRASCRGHDQEVTDLAVSGDNRLAASGSLDRSIRVWNLQ
ncbi:Bromodomain and WD repeat-containing protein 1, partial [Monoraphidium neglectum]